MIFLVYGNAEAFAAEEEPEDAEFPVFEAVDVGMGLVIEVMEGAGGDEVFASAFTARKEEWDIGDLFGEDAGGTIEPGDTVEWVVEAGADWFGVAAGKPGGGGGGEFLLNGRLLGTSDVKSK